MDNLAAQPSATNRARQAVDCFVKRFQPSYRQLARHAALPLVLTPELLSYLRNRFLRGEVPWVAEADLLLSELCAPVGYDLFAMDTGVRAVLLEEMRETEGLAQMQQVARLLIQYVRHLARTNPMVSRHELQAQQWAAMVYLDNHRDNAVREMAEAISNCVVSETVSAGVAETLINQSEMARLARLVQDLSPQLGAYPVLVSYAETTSRLLNDATGAEAQRLWREQRLNEQTTVLDIALPMPGLMIAPQLRQTIEATTLGPIKNRYALVVGVNAPDNRSYGKLQFCVNDAKALAQVLSKYGYTVVCMHDEAAREELIPTTGKISQMLMKLSEVVEPDDLLLFYFSGHGTVANDDLALLTKDAHTMALETTALPVHEVERAMRLSQAGHLVIMLETLPAQAYLDSTKPTFPEEMRVRTFAYIAPSVSSDGPEFGHGVFTHHLLQGLEGAADVEGNGAITVKNLVEHLTHASVQSKERFYELLVRLEGDANNIILVDDRDRKGAATSVAASLAVPALDPARFFDREEILEQIFEVLRENRLNVALVGEAGIGKSTILEMVRALGPARLDLPPDAFIQFSVSAFKDKEEFYAALSDNLDIEILPGNNLAGALGNNRSILCLDGIDERVESSAPNLLAGDLLLELRRLTYGSDSPLKVITASRHPLESLAISGPPVFDSPLKGSFVEMQVTPFSTEVASDFIRQGMAGTGMFFSDEGDIEEAVNSLGGHPARLQAYLGKMLSGYQKWREKRNEAVKDENLFPIANPYVVGSPVSGSLFVGRVAVMSRLREYIQQEQDSPPVLLYGQRRIGKTSILQNLERFLTPHELLVPFDLSRYEARANVGEPLADLTSRIYRAWSVRYPHAAPRLREYDELNLSEYLDQPYEAFDRFLRRLDQERKSDQTQNNLRIVIAVDEFSAFDRAMDDSPAENILTHLQMMLKQYSWLRAILATERPPMDIQDLPTAQARLIHVSFLDPDSARQLITKPMPDFPIAYDSDAVERIIEVTSGQPYLVQAICYILVERFNQRAAEYKNKLEREAIDNIAGTPEAQLGSTFEGLGVYVARQLSQLERRFTLNDVDAVIDSAEFNRRAGAYFEGIWERASRVEAGIGLLGTLSRVEMSLDEIASFSNVGREQLRVSLKDLQDQDVILPHGEKYRFTIELLRRWVARRMAPR